MSRLIRFGGALALLACAAVASPQSTADAKAAIADSWITTQVYAKFFVDRDVKARNLTVHTDRGVVTVSGAVESTTEHDRAIAAAKSVDGVKQVVDRLSLTPAGRSTADRGRNKATPSTRAESVKAQAKTAADRVGKEIADTLVTTKVQAMFYLDRDVKAMDIDVTTHGGVVTLTGSVDSEAARQKAVADARSTEGVKQVVDKLTVRK
jgi:hyperosmotically inducible protein